MNNNKKKLESLQRIMKQAVEISTNSDIDVFVSYSGHVDYIGISVYLQGWDMEKDADFKKEIWFTLDDKEQCLKNLAETIEYLEEMEKK